jgi:DNA-binding NarL/FixJ family response regulator
VKFDANARLESDMTDRMQHEEHDPRHHTQKIKQMLNDAASHAREDVDKHGMAFGPATTTDECVVDFLGRRLLTKRQDEVVNLVAEGLPNSRSRYARGVAQHTL